MDHITDITVFAGCWPPRLMPQRTPAELKEHLAPKGVTRAWLTPAEGILAPDPMQANEPLAKAIDGDGFFIPVAVINPILVEWETDAVHCLDKLGFRAFKLFPSYHGYELSDACADEAAQFAAARNVPLCVQVNMMDQRSQHPAMVVDPPKPEAVADLAQRNPDTRFLACGVMKPYLAKLSQASNMCAEISMVESDQTLRNAVDTMGAERVVFGSHSPFHYFEAMRAKLDAPAENVLPEAVEMVASGNAEALLDA